MPPTNRNDNFEPRLVAKIIDLYAGAMSLRTASNPLTRLREQRFSEFPSPRFADRRAVGTARAPDGGLFANRHV